MTTFEPPAEADSEFQHEKDQLADVIQHIKSEIARLKRQSPATAAYQEAANEIQRVLDGLMRRYELALPAPYFGRVDYFATDQPAEVNGGEANPSLTTAYLGVTKIGGTGVVSWTDPVAELYYISGRAGTYTTPKGVVSAQVDLKRYLRVQDQHLEAFHDILSPMLTSPMVESNRVLNEALNQTVGEDGHLQPILPTIEPEQYRAISRYTDKVLIVQGAAGSGKSVIGFQRIAYLLSPFNNLPQQQTPTPRTTLFIGPSRAFLEYASDMLPQLGVSAQVRQTRFSDWLVGQMTRRPRINLRIWKNLLSPGATLTFNPEAELFKGSVAMADVIDRHVTGRANDIRRRARNSVSSLAIRDTRTTVSEAEVRAILGNVLPSRGPMEHINRRREAFIDRVLDRVLADLPRRANVPRTETASIRANVRNTYIIPWVSQFWEHIDFADEYTAMLLNSDPIARSPRNSISEQEARALEDSAAQAETSGFDDSDLGALAYMDHVLNGTITSTFRHIVVDEAQDLSPIEFKLLSLASINNYFTVLGDTAQRLGLHRGIRSWRELNRVFDRSDIEVQHALTSHRASSQITKFNNRLLRTFDKTIATPKPSDRERYRVEYHPCSNVPDMHCRVVQQLQRIRSLAEMEDATIAILVRDNNQFNSFAKFWEGLGQGGIATLSDAHWGGARTVLGRIYDAKGLEYDAVIVMGVGQAFHDVLFDKKLLYLATTRAKHHLSIFWTGKQSPILGAISDRGLVRWLADN